MLYAYINYPNPHITIHRSPDCGHIQQQHKVNQRLIDINVETFSEEIHKFQKRQYRLGSTQEINDLWLRVDFGDADFEIQIVDYVRKLLAVNYSPFNGIKLKHCEECRKEYA